MGGYVSESRSVHPKTSLGSQSVPDDGEDGGAGLFFRMGRIKLGLA